MNQLDGKAVIVTGASGGIGRQLSRALAQRGCRLGLLCRDAEKLDRLAEELRRDGVPFSAHPVDLRRRTATHEAVAAVQQKLGPVDVLIHNAGVGGVTSAANPDLDELEKMLEVNYLGGIYCIEAVLPSMLRRRSGHLVGVNSLAALRGMAWTAGYSASKAAFATCLESLRPALRRRGIAVSTCYLGFVRTPMSDSLPLHSALLRVEPRYAAGRIIRTIVRRRREAYFPWYDACVARFVRCLPARLFDALMANVGRRLLKGDY